MFYKFSLGRKDAPASALWPQPADNAYSDGDGRPWGPQLCTRSEAGTGSSDSTSDLVGCRNNTQAGANLRLRFAPELHISDNLRVLSQIDLLDNLVMGSTPSGYHTSGGGSAVGARSAYTPWGYADDTAVAPTAGDNALRDSIAVKRAWGEYATPIGELRFGRMPDHWGLGMVHNSGDDYDGDYQSTIDRIQIATRIASLDLYAAASWDFPNEGATSDHLSLPQGQPYDISQLDDVDQWTLIVARRREASLQRLDLAKGKLVVNGGAYITYRQQLLANDTTGTCATGAAAFGCAPGDLSSGFVRRDASAWMPDLWLQVLYRKFSFEAELATVQGSIQNVSNSSTPDDTHWKIREWGLATEMKQRLVEDRLRLGMNFGWASGDPDAAQSGGGMGLTPGLQGMQAQLGDRTFETFRFHPNYRVDLILNRNLLSRVQGTYYFRPNVEYDFIRNPEGQRLGGAVAGIWTRASQFVQTPGHARDLGIELNGTVYYQAKDGSLNDDTDRKGGFYTMVQYGVLFPLSGLGYQSLEADRVSNQGARSIDTNAAQILRWYIGVLF